MKRILLLLCLLVPVAAFAGKAKKADKQTAQWRYEISPVSVGTQGSVVLKVWSFSKSPRIATEQSKKNAVHGVLFKGVPAKDRIPGKKALVSAAQETEHEKFFDDFFSNGGGYMRFVALTNTGSMGGDDVVKVGKEYKVGVTVTVSYNDLRSYLESQNIIRKLDAGF